MFFFFQAEDGIRDKLVTGVQTCALPIWLTARLRALRRYSLDLCLGRMVGADNSEPVYVGRFGLTDSERSEERRVGKSVDLGGRRIIKKKKKKEKRISQMSGTDKRQ